MYLLGVRRPMWSWLESIVIGCFAREPPCPRHINTRPHTHSRRLHIQPPAPPPLLSLSLSLVYALLLPRSTFAPGVPVMELAVWLLGWSTS